MTTGASFHLIDYSGLTPAVSQDDFNKLKADNDEYVLADFDAKATKIMDAGIQHYGILPAKAGAILIKADSTEAFKAWGAVYKGETPEAGLKTANHKVVPFRAPVTGAGIDHVSSPFMAAAANDEGRGRAPKIERMFAEATRGPAFAPRTMGLENTIAA